MGLFNKIKQGLGIGTAKVTLEVPAQIARGTKEVDGKVTITAQSDQKVKSIKVALVEKSVTTINNETRDVRKDIQTFYLKEPFGIKKDETRTIPFKLSVDLGDSVSVQMFGGTLTVSGSSNGQRSFEIMATADLDGVALDPTATQAVIFI